MIMTEMEEKKQQESGSNQTNFILLGAVFGALAGAGAGFMLSKQLEEGQDIQLSAKDGLKIGGSMLALFKQISTLGK